MHSKQASIPKRSASSLRNGVYWLFIVSILLFGNVTRQFNGRDSSHGNGLHAHFRSTRVRADFLSKSSIEVTVRSRFVSGERADTRVSIGANLIWTSSRIRIEAFPAYKVSVFNVSRASDLAVLSPAILYLENSYLVFCRITCIPEMMPCPSVVWMQAFSLDFLPASSGSILPISFNMSVSSPGPEDPRALQTPKGPILVFNMKDSVSNPRSMFIFSVASRKVTRLLLPRAHNTVQKNWAPFWFEGALHFLLYANPLTVLQCDPESGMCECRYSQLGNDCLPVASDKVGALRLGSPLAELTPSSFLCSLHSQLLDISGGVRGYSGHLATLSTSPWGWVAISSPLNLLHVSDLKALSIIKSGYSSVIIYPTSILVQIHDLTRLLLSIHTEDHESITFQLKFPPHFFQAILKSCRQFRHSHCQDWNILPLDESDSLAIVPSWQNSFQVVVQGSDHDRFTSRLVNLKQKGFSTRF